MPSLSVLAEVNERDDQGWLALLDCLMFRGVTTKCSLMPNKIDGALIDGETAWRHLRALAGSYAPKHQDKVAAFVLLCRTWWEWGIWEDSDGRRYEAGAADTVTAEDRAVLGFS